MRKRFKQSVIASSENYNAKKASHLLMLQQNREANKEFLDNALSTAVTKPISDIQSFENGLKAQIERFRQSRQCATC